MTLPTQNPPTFPSHAVLTVIGEAIEVHEAMARDAAEDAAEEARLYGESFTQVVPPGDFDPSPGLDEPEDAVVLAQIDAGRRRMGRGNGAAEPARAVRSATGVKRGSANARKARILA